jgi:hypothetical protein
MHVRAGCCYALKPADGEEWAALAAANGAPADTPYFYEALSSCGPSGTFAARELRSVHHLAALECARVRGHGAGARDLCRTENDSRQEAAAVLMAVQLHTDLEWRLQGYEAAAWEPPEDFFVCRYRRVTRQAGRQADARWWCGALSRALRPAAGFARRAKL